MSKWISSKKRRTKERGGGLASNISTLFHDQPGAVSVVADGDGYDDAAGAYDDSGEPVASTSNISAPLSYDGAARRLSRSSSVASDAIDETDHLATVHPVSKRRKTAGHLDLVETSANGKLSTLPRGGKPMSSPRRGKGRAKGATTSNANSHFVATVEWPEHFKKLQRTFQAINTVYTFLSTRKHLASTYENLKSSVEAIIKRCVTFPTKNCCSIPLTSPAVRQTSRGIRYCADQIPRPHPHQIRLHRQRTASSAFAERSSSQEVA